MIKIIEILLQKTKFSTKIAEELEYDKRNALMLGSLSIKKRTHLTKRLKEKLGIAKFMLLL